ncbi:unnamed protein product [Anisakis simplex]|uniref:G_PROTEIN_RECEP_F1_2 domain-containing protein n=1 Tax=Anisakis simplex TaxID=6269 RepID=A0A0M3JZH8_ANISI|nr:unnamed protein product [Anisakis simplex]
MAKFYDNRHRQVKAESNRQEKSIATFRSWERKRDDLIVVCVWLVMLSYALISNILILIGIARSSTMRSATSYWFIISLAVCDIVMTVISLFHLVPATAFHSAFLEFHSTRNILMIFFYDLFWYTAVLQLGLMACNRFVSIVYPMEYKWLFSRNKSLLIIFFGYLLGFCVSLPSLFPCCHTLWNSDYYITVYDPMDTWYKYVDMSVNSLSLILMIISYAVIIYKVRESGRAMAKYQLTIRSRQRSTTHCSTESDEISRANSLRPPRSQVSKKEMRLFIQFFLVSVVFLLTWTTWQWLPHMSESKWAYFVMTSLFFINNSVNPTVYLLYNTQLRRELRYVLCRNGTVVMSHHRHKRAAALLSDSDKKRSGTSKNKKLSKMGTKNVAATATNDNTTSSNSISNNNNNNVNINSNANTKANNDNNNVLMNDDADKKSCNANNTQWMSDKSECVVGSNSQALMLNTQLYYIDNNGIKQAEDATRECVQQDDENKGSCRTLNEAEEAAGRCIDEEGNGNWVGDLNWGFGGEEQQQQHEGEAAAEVPEITAKGEQARTTQTAATVCSSSRTSSSESSSSATTAAAATVQTTSSDGTGSCIILGGTENESSTVATSQQQTTCSPSLPRPPTTTLSMVIAGSMPPSAADNKVLVSNRTATAIKSVDELETCPPATSAANATNSNSNSDNAASHFGATTTTIMLTADQQQIQQKLAASQNAENFQAPAAQGKMISSSPPVGLSNKSQPYRFCKRLIVENGVTLIAKSDISEV